KRLGHAAPLLRQRRLELVGVEGAPGREAGAVAEEAAAADGQELPVGDVVEELALGDVDQPNAGADELERARVRKAPALRGRDVDDDADDRIDELLRRDLVEVGVVDDRDVVSGEATGEALRPLVESRVAREL